MATENLTGEKLAKRFGWWWRGDPVPGKSLRRAFPEKSEQGIRRFLWKELERAALNYELASRANGRKKYLLGKPFDSLTRERMCELAILWPRKPRPLQPIRFLLYAEQPGVTKTLRLLESEDSVALSTNELTRQVAKRTRQTTG
jgi:hypothetical protein